MSYDDNTCARATRRLLLCVSIGPRAAEDSVRGDEPPPRETSKTRFSKLYICTERVNNERRRLGFVRCEMTRVSPKIVLARSDINVVRLDLLI